MDGESSAAPALGGWYKFQIWFALFFSAVLDAFSSFEILGGRVYELAALEAAEAHAAHGWLLVPDIAAGVGAAGLAVFSLVTRHLLAKKRKAGIECLHIVHWADVALILLYRGILSFTLGAVCFDALSIFELVFTLAMIVINKPYFEKREELFS